jgi:DNA-directed RNA polymerase specialized sigma24 family protein
MNLEATRRLAPELQVVDQRLRGWGDWARKGVPVPGWPAVSLTAKMAEWHEIGVRPEGSPHPVEIPESVAIIDKLVAKLPPDQRRVVLVNYSRSDPLEIKARIAKLNVRRYRGLLDRARWSVRYGLELIGC